MTNFIWAHVGSTHNYDKDAVQKVGGDVLQGFSNAIVASSSQAAKTKQQNGQIKEMDRNRNKRQNDHKGVNQVHMKSVLACLSPISRSKFSFTAHKKILTGVLPL